MLRLLKTDALNLVKALSRAGGLDDVGYLRDLVLTLTNIASSRSLNLNDVIAQYQSSGGEGIESLTEVLRWDRSFEHDKDVEKYLPVVEDFVAYLIEERGSDQESTDPRRQREAVSLISSLLGEMGAGIEPKDVPSRLEKASLYDGEGNFSELISLLGDIHKGGNPLASEESVSRAFAILGDSPLASLLIQNVL